MAALVGILGAGAVGGLGFILQGMRGDIRTNGERIEANGKRIEANGKHIIRIEERTIRVEERTIRVEERTIRIEERTIRIEERTLSEFGEVKQVLARIEAAQTERGRQLTQLAADHGERIAALERVSGSAT